ncbi:MAG: hypothetical protein KDI16_11130 [Halioglobus sp.]|nr:hypothetical protein [Halioglobus sp.]
MWCRADPSSGKVRVERPGVERPGVERPGVERPGLEWPGRERPASDRVAVAPHRPHAIVTVSTRAVGQSMDQREELANTVERRRQGLQSRSN